MAHGDNHAKKIVIKRAKTLTADLSNGSAGNVKKQGEALGLIVEMITPLYEAEFVTADECKEKQNKVTKHRSSRIKLGPFEFEGQISTTLIQKAPSILCLVGVGFMVGDKLGWW